jgi:REP element-mobilizing transposase RayT
LDSFDLDYKNRQPFLNKNIRKKIFQHIKDNAFQKGIKVDFINGENEHVHLLVSLNSDQCIASVAKLLKGESSFWINKNNFINSKFAWQEEYIAVSVSNSQINKVREYIKNQENHHKKRSFSEEFELFMNQYNFEKGLKP